MRWLAWCERLMIDRGPYGRTSSDDPLALAIEEGDLQQCLEALAARRKSQSEREGEIQRLRDGLREVLSLRQEAILVVAGLLD